MKSPCSNVKENKISRVYDNFNVFSTIDVEIELKKTIKCIYIRKKQLYMQKSFIQSNFTMYLHLNSSSVFTYFSNTKDF